MKRILIHLLVAAGGALALAGCSEYAGDNPYADAREHLEFHALGPYETFDEMHRFLDRHLLDHNPNDPDSYD